MRSICNCIIVLCVASASLACKSKPSDKDDGPPKTSLDEAKKRVESKRDEVNRLVPVDLKESLKFTVAAQKGDHTVGLVPEGWVPGDILPGVLKPRDLSAGSVTSFRIDHNCDGMCEPKDWPPVVQKVDVDGMKTGGEVKLDEAKDGERVVIVKGEWGGKPRVLITVARWNAKASRYFACRVDLDGSYAEAADAFEKACRAFVITDWRG